MLFRSEGQQGQNPHKIITFIVFHQTRASRRFLVILTKFDSKLTPSRPKISNFDPAIRIDRNQRHCEDYQILIPTTIHGSKSELERQRYHEN